MSSVKPVSMDGKTYQVAADKADLYGAQKAAFEAGKGPAPDKDLVTQGSSAGSSNDQSAQGISTGANVEPVQNNMQLPALNLTPASSNSTSSGASSAPADTAASGSVLGGTSASDGTPFNANGATIGAASAGSNDPTVTVANTSKTRRYYKIEASAGQDPQSLNNNTFYLDPGQTAKVNPGQGYIGAITDQGSTTNATNAGTRQELNFGTAGKTWYDADLERGGATSSTLGPTDSSLNADDGSSSLVGDQYAYLTAGSVQGQATSAAAAADDKKNRVISTQKMSITSK